MTETKNKPIEKAETVQAGAPSGRSGHRRSDSPERGAALDDGRCAAGNLAVQQLLRSGAIQAKLTIGQPNDPEEQEADRVAERVVAVPAVSGEAARGDAQGSSVEHELRPMASGPTIRRHGTGGGDGAAPSGGEHKPNFGAGRPLDPATRSFMEARFGRDFESVRIHTNGEAEASANALDARAYTFGRDIVFAGGAYAPESREGRRLLAHELAHVVQQDRGARPKTIRRQGTAGTRPRTGGTGPPNVGSCTLRSGTMRWSLVPMVGYVNARIEFIPNSGVAAASRTISFIQTVSETLTTGGFLGLFTTTWATRPQVDVLPGERDPFYGAQRDPASGRWGDEPGSTQVRPGDYQGTGGPREGSRPFIAASLGSAVLNDSPMLLLNQTKRFETVAVVVETGQVLASFRWNIQCWIAGVLNQTSSTIVQSADCVEGASADFSSAVESFYRGIVTLDGFAAGSADLPATHPQLLAPIVDSLRQNPGRRAIVGGAATSDEPNPVPLSRSRAERVKAYLVGQGIAASRIDVEAYGSDWARTPVTDPGAAQANRRVQITILQGPATQ